MAIDIKKSLTLCSYSSLFTRTCYFTQRFYLLSPLSGNYYICSGTFPRTRYFAATVLCHITASFQQLISISRNGSDYKNMLKLKSLGSFLPQNLKREANQLINMYTVFNITLIDHNVHVDVFEVLD